MLTAEQKAKLREIAEEQGHDPDAFIAEAERADAEDEGQDATAPGAPTIEPPKLFQYHLPFITVKELRTKWLGLDGSVADDAMLCGEWLTKHGGALGAEKDSGDTAVSASDEAAG